MTLQEIKQRFFSFRNGIVAKAFLDAGDPHSVIFGLQIPQIAEIARECGKDPSLAQELWADAKCRESRLLACRLFDASRLKEEEALKLCQEVKSREEADYLAFALLRHLPYASSLLTKITQTENGSPLLNYMATALKRNLEN